MEMEELKDKISSNFCIVDFYAPWCRDCVKISPVLDELEKDYKVIKINIEENENISNEFGIRRIPTLIFFKDGNEVGNRLVEPTKQQILDEIGAIK